MAKLIITAKRTNQVLDIPHPIDSAPAHLQVEVLKWFKANFDVQGIQQVMQGLELMALFNMPGIESEQVRIEFRQS